MKPLKLFVAIALLVMCSSVLAQGRGPSREIKLEETFVVDEFGNDSVKPAPTFDVFADFVKLKSSVSLKYPKGYDLVESRLSAWSTDMRTLRKRLSAAKYRYLLASPDKGHLILYPALDLPTRALPLGYKDGRYLVTDINGALDVEGKPLIKANVNPFTEEDFGFAKYLKAVEGYEVDIDTAPIAAKMGADRVVVTHFKLAQPYKREYAYCMAVYIFKDQRSAIFAKCFFKEDSAAEREKALNALTSNIKYGKKGVDSSEAANKKIDDAYKLFRMKYESAGIR